MNKILEIIHGSNLYGLNTPSSDLDIYGIYLENSEAVFEDYFYNKNSKGRELDLSEKVKLPNGKNAPEAIDKKFLSFKKYVRLALNCNPNLAEVLYAPKDKILFKNKIGERLISLRKDFLSKKAYYTFGSYAKNQQKRAGASAESFRLLENAQNKLETSCELKKYMGEYENEGWFKKIFEIHQINYKVIGTNYKIVKHINIKNAVKEIEKIIGLKTNRKDIISKFNYDTKMASHNLRLFYECEDILLNHKITFPILGRDIVMAVKNGEVPLEDVRKMSQEKWEDVEKAFKISKLPEVPNVEKIYELVKDVYYDEIFKN